MTCDILYCLPQEILGAIFERLTFRERIRCMSLSQHWRAWLQSSPHLLWQDISDMHCDLVLNLAPYSTFFKAQHVKRVHLTEYSNIERQMAAASFFAKSGCSSIKTLDIPCHDNMMVPDVKALINLSRNTLVDLTMRCIIDECLIPTVMATCPKLHTFRYHHRFTSRNSYSQSSINLQSLHTQPQLQIMHHHLAEFVLDATIYLSDAATLVTLMPNLERIRLHICNTRREGDGVVFDDVGLILDVMNSYCPRMKNIQLGGTGSRSTFTSFAKIRPGSTRRGLCELSIETAEGLHDKHVVPLILNHHTTLQALHTRSSYSSTSSSSSPIPLSSPPPKSIMQCLASAPYPNLRDLRVNFMWDTYNNYDGNQDLVRMISNAQQLESIHFCVSEQSSRLVNDALFDTLAQLVHLRSLNLQGGNHCQLLSPDSLIRWARHGRFSCMQQLHLPGLSQAITNQVLDAITDRMAQDLIVFDIERACLITDHALRRFTDKIVASTAEIMHRRRAALTWLNVTECTGISKETIRYAHERLGPHITIFS
ncbi:hypothetical protein O0I10_009655 [Lichtheimia ornata]|uniref:F-box domain-containing protein n=1 Tax=Lichtheimia ornata TaxID=688661 RepID=A0AAD7XRY4_9FUNG|nr:uncharacterized protein O0I10_009655 [Lichtheimia ornata]KAJ8654604.1 hypothetical protein O0I10_009655 [Lichtheimia ornata]